MHNPTNSLASFALSHANNAQTLRQHAQNASLVTCFLQTIHAFRSVLNNISAASQIWLVYHAHSPAETVWTQKYFVLNVLTDTYWWKAPVWNNVVRDFIGQLRLLRSARPAKISALHAKLWIFAQIARTVFIFLHRKVVCLTVLMAISKV